LIDHALASVATIDHALASVVTIDHALASVATDTNDINSSPTLPHDGHRLLKAKLPIQYIRHAAPPMSEWQSLQVQTCCYPVDTF
jgi:hypothetical protein